MITGNKRSGQVIVRNLNDKEVMDTTYIAHGGAVARMVLTYRELEAMDFFAFAHLEAGMTIEEHVDPYEEIYFIMSGSGVMGVGEETQEVKPGDAIWLPRGVPHKLHNNSEGPLQILVVAATPK
jgi:mannose-6-phosphate isomerase-like protein (cupin superfamily)